MSYLPEGREGPEKEGVGGMVCNAKEGEEIANSCSCFRVAPRNGSPVRRTMQRLRPLTRNIRSGQRRRNSIQGSSTGDRDDDFSPTSRALRPPALCDDDDGGAIAAG